MTIDTFPEDGVHDSARLWYERSGRFVKLSVEAAQEAHKYDVAAKDSQDPHEKARLNTFAEFMRAQWLSLQSQAERFALEGMRAEDLKRW